MDAEEGLPALAPILDFPLADGAPSGILPADVARRRLLTTLASWLFGTARMQPLVVLVEDLHWADPSSLELLHLLVEQGTRVPLMLIGTARPQFQPPWPLRAHHTQLTLSRLPRRYVRDLVHSVAAQAPLLAEIVEEVAQRTDGVPLFVEELTKAVLEGATLSTHEIPATLADSLMARLDWLGPQAKEVAQVGSVCGREFSFALLRAVHPLEAAELEALIAKLVDAELLHARGLPPDASYTFKHALVQDAAYGSLLKGRRRALHARLAEVLERDFPVEAGEHPEVLAQHHAAALQVEAALDAWQRAGDRAMERGAHREAEQFLQRGLELLAEQPEQPQRHWREFHLLLQLRQARLFSAGFSAAPAAETLARAMVVGERLAPPAQLVTLLLASFTSELTRNGPAAARPLGEQILRVAERARDPILMAAVHFALGMTDFHLGRFSAARARFETGIAGFDDSKPSPFPIDIGLSLRLYHADTLWYLGLVDQARAGLRTARERAARSARRVDRVWAAHLGAVLHSLLHEPVEVAACAREVTDLCNQEPNPQHAAMAKVMEGWSLSQSGETETGRLLACRGVEEMHGLGQRLGLEFYHGLLADTHRLAGDRTAALAALAEGEAVCPDQEAARAGTLGRRAEILAESGAPAAAVEEAFAAALACARRQEARSLELRFGTSFARWLHAAGAGGRARALLAPLYDEVSEGRDSRDAREARALLDALA